MSYHSWTTDGFGICVDDIETDASKLLQLAAMETKVLNDVREYLNKHFDGKEYNDEDLTLDDFSELEGEYCERDVAYVLYQVINEIPVVYVDDYNGVPYILYCPTYPWNLPKEEIGLTREKVVEIFNKYVSILTDKHVVIDYYSVENGG